MIVVGLICHLYLSTIYGLLYGIYNSALTQATRSSLRRQVVLGPLYGTLLWLANFFVFAPVYYPWLLVGTPAQQLALRALAYGLPLGLLFGNTERHRRAERNPEFSG